MQAGSQSTMQGGGGVEVSPYSRGMWDGFSQTSEVKVKLTATGLTFLEIGKGPMKLGNNFLHSDLNRKSGKDNHTRCPTR